MVLPVDLITFEAYFYGAMRTLRALIPLSLLLNACVFIDDYDKFQLSEGLADSGAGTDDGGTGDGGTEPPLDCVDGTFETPLSSMPFDTSAGADEGETSCGGVAAPELTFEWTAPSAGHYRFTATGDGFEPILAIREGSCEGPELECEATPIGETSAVIARYVEAGQRLLLVVDGRSGGSGTGELLVERPGCPAIQLVEAVLPVEHGTAVGAPYDGWSCPGDSSLNVRSYRYTAEADGLYSFLAEGQDGYPELQLEAGPFCGAPVAQCGSASPPAGWPNDRRAEVIREMHAGESITLVAKGRGGDLAYSLDVDRLGDAACGDGPLDVSGPMEVSLPEDGPHRVVPSCGTASATDWDGTVRPNPDANFTMDLPPPDPGCSFGCTISIEAGFPFAVARSFASRDSGCPFTENSCIRSETVNVEPPLHQAEIHLDGSEHLQTITVQRLIYPETAPPQFLPTTDELAITTSCFGIC